MKLCFPSFSGNCLCQSSLWYWHTLGLPPVLKDAFWWVCVYMCVCVCDIYIYICVCVWYIYIYHDSLRMCHTPWFGNQGFLWGSLILKRQSSFLQKGNSDSSFTLSLLPHPLQLLILFYFLHTHNFSLFSFLSFFSSFSCSMPFFIHLPKWTQL